jgi:hypothetical protein
MFLSALDFPEPVRPHFSDLDQMVFAGLLLTFHDAEDE